MAIFFRRKSDLVLPHSKPPLQTGASLTSPNCKSMTRLHERGADETEERRVRGAELAKSTYNSVGEESVVAVGDHKSQ